MGGRDGLSVNLDCTLLSVGLLDILLLILMLQFCCYQSGCGFVVMKEGYADYGPRPECHQ